ncbi:Phosphoribosylformylglycinamidine synthase [Prochlorococcus marinus str. SS51]|nr:Phosphoribosylformylglycinamidine synthase [Prochlorococcus marinus str. SS2]KGG23818.1 Phosphoribosylformylglycinamidine synthase [Prochlorococcus marinus str. SS35]KGG33099.1 Phosphoribosylformylglycinamidine synthase [Prochlorococcus marinus str. SS51]
MDLDMIDISFNRLIKSKDYLVDYNVELALKKEGLTKADYIEICNRLKRSPNRTELGMFGVMWSEHCCYRNSRSLLSNFPTTGKNILVGPGENAGVVDLGEGQRLAFKIESHNHPSAIEPFQGAATGVGGILRDIFTMGARPIALLNSLRFGPLDTPINVGLLEGVVSGIAHYGNCVGVPTVGGEVAFDKSYSGNPLVNAMALGIMETKEIVCSGAKGIDFPVIYVGSTTGRDGMGGASFASSELTQASIDDRPAVQVGDPFLEKGLIEGCLEAFKTGYVVAAQDMGAAGLTCSCSEMAAKGGVGIELDLDLVPAREKNMTAYEFLLSESQERMLFVVEPGKEELIMNKFRKWGLQAKVVGKVLEENIVRVIHEKQIVVNLPADSLAEDTPVNKHELLEEPPGFIKDHWKWDETSLPKVSIKGVHFKENNTILDWNQIILRLLDDPTIASKRWIYNQYDYQVQNNTIIAPGIGDAALIRLREIENQNQNSNRGIAAVVDCPNRWVALDPERGAIAAVAEASRNISCVGAKPLAVTDNLNFSSPEDPIGYWQLAKACKGLSKACVVLETPVTGGNVSLYNETALPNGLKQPIQPTPVVGMIGLIQDINSATRQGWKDQGDQIYLLGTSIDPSILNNQNISLAATSYLENIYGLKTGRPPLIDLEFEKLVQLFLRESIANNLIKSAHDISDGGLVIGLAESCISSGLGIECNLPEIDNRLDKLLFAEGGSRVLVSVSPNNIHNIKNSLNNFNIANSEQISFNYLGTVTDNKYFQININQTKIIDLSVNEITNKFERSIPRRINSTIVS